MRLLTALLVFPVLSSLAQEVPTGAALVQQHRIAAGLRRATADYDRGDFQSALARLDTLGGDIGVLNLRAAVLTKLGQYGQAARIFQQILDADPDYLPAAFNAGEVQFLSGDREGALGTFRGLLQRDPKNELLAFRVFLCQMALGLFAEAGETAGAIRSSGSTPAWYYARALLARRGGDEGKARKHLKAAHSLYGEDACRLFDESVASAGL